MDAGGHERIAELVNWALSGPFPEIELKAGSTDPDTCNSGRAYVGEWSKHHFDPGGPDTGRYHGADTIRNIMVECCAHARRHWLSNQRTAAAFEFGVGTHFFMDGFICSPSVNQDVHQRGDYEFGRAARQMMAAPVQRPPEEEFCLQYIDVRVRTVAAHFGNTAPVDVAVAYNTLVHLGYAVTAPEVPRLLQERGTAATNLLTQRLEQEWNTLSGWLAPDSVELSQTVHAIASGLTAASRVSWVFVAVAHYHRGGKMKQTLLARLLLATLERRVIGDSERPFLHVLNRCTDVVAAATRCSCNLTVEWDRQWYAIDRFLEGHSNVCKHLANEWNARALSTRVPIRTKITDTLHTWEARWVDEAFPKRWNNSLPDRIAHSGGTIAVICVCSALAAVVVGTIASAMQLLTFALIFGLLFSLPALALWRFWIVCSRVSAYLWRHEHIHCTKCGQASEIEVLPNEKDAICPICSQTGIPFGPQ